MGFAITILREKQYKQTRGKHKEIQPVDIIRAKKQGLEKWILDGGFRGYKGVYKWYGLSVGRREQVEHFCSCAERSFAHGAMWSLASAYQLYLDQRQELPQPPQPMLSIWGSADRSHPASNAHSLARLYSDVHSVTFDHLGHTPELEEPALVLDAITNFVDRS